jgi:ABC-type antimicrobial peptide transport system permease subunit
MAAGLLAAAMTSRTVASLLFGLQASDVWSYALALAVLTIIGLAASVLPAWRAARTSPMQALRQ